MTKALIRLFIKNAEDTRSAAVREQYGILSGAVGLACNLFLFALKLTIGLVTGAISIAADAFNNLSDGLSCMISIVGFKVSNREPDEKHPFGYGRTEYIAGLIVSFIILLVGFEFFKTSLDRIIHPSAVAFSALLTGILAVSMLVKLWMGLFNTTLGRRIDSRPRSSYSAWSRAVSPRCRLTAMWAFWSRRSSSGRASASRAIR